MKATVFSVVSYRRVWSANILVLETLFIYVREMKLTLRGRNETVLSVL